MKLLKQITKKNGNMVAVVYATIYDEEKGLADSIRFVIENNMTTAVREKRYVSPIDESWQEITDTEFYGAVEVEQKYTKARLNVDNIIHDFINANIGHDQKRIHQENR